MELRGLAARNPRPTLGSPVALFLLITAILMTLTGCGRRADLLPVLGPDLLAECVLSAQGLEITVENRGSRYSRATTTVVQFDSLPEVRLPTRPIAGGQHQLLHLNIPDVCHPAGCLLKITVDAKDEVIETDETNNGLQTRCQFP